MKHKRVLAFGIWRRVFWQNFTDISETRTDLILEICLLSVCSLLSLHFDLDDGGKSFLRNVANHFTRLYIVTHRHENLSSNIGLIYRQFYDQDSEATAELRVFVGNNFRAENVWATGNESADCQHCKRWRVQTNNISPHDPLCNLDSYRSERPHVAG
jgi:hypothetical protein